MFFLSIQWRGMGKRKKRNVFVTMHSMHFIYGYMASDTQLERKPSAATRVLLYASSHTQDDTYHRLCYTSRGALAGTRNGWVVICIRRALI